ncbi:unnamed protein product, partial [Ectocarpus sp. 12 AP-2014]
CGFHGRSTDLATARRLGEATAIRGAGDAVFETPTPSLGSSSPPVEDALNGSHRSTELKAKLVSRSSSPRARLRAIHQRRTRPSSHTASADARPCTPGGVFSRLNDTGCCPAPNGARHSSTTDTAPTPGAAFTSNATT